MDDIAKALTGSFSKFVAAWLIPSAITLGLAWLFIVPAITESGAGSIIGPSNLDHVSAAFIFLLLTLTSAILFAYAALPIYRVLEGYLLPDPLFKFMLRRQLRKWHRLKASERRWQLTGRLSEPTLIERLAAYPRDRESVRATRLGNALRAMESFARDSYGFDSQSLWYELMGVVPADTRRDVEDSRSPVDFFVSLITHAAALSMAALVVGTATGHWPLYVLASIAIATIPGSYQLALSNVIDWGASVKAVVNLGRRDLAVRLGLKLPKTLKSERHMWGAYTYTIEYHSSDVEVQKAYDRYRLDS